MPIRKGRVSIEMLLLWSFPGLTDIKTVEEKLRQKGQSDQNDCVDSLYASSLTLQCAALLKTLDYEGRRVREDQLWEKGAYPETFQWLWQSAFADWASETGSLFWVCGKPASGKSTLMEHIVRSGELQNRLRRGVSDEWTVVCHFFFDFGVSKDIRNNFEGFLRSLLYQLVDVSRDDKEDMSPKLEPEERWSMRVLQERLSIVLKKRSNPICILLDGLDEYHGDKWDLAGFLREIASSRVKLCIASRPDLVFDNAFKHIPTIRMQDWNTPAIDIMVRLTIQRSVAGSGFYNDKDVVLLAKEISEKAQGVFLWARFAIYELRDGWTQGLDLASLQKRLENVPDELEQIYARIFRKLNVEQKQYAAHMLQLVCYARETLTLSELYVATKLAAGSKSPLEGQISPSHIQQFEKRILAATGGVLEVFRNRKSQKSQKTDEVLVNVIHRTVRTYLDTKGWSQLLGAAHEGTLHAEVLWLRICAAIFPPSFKGLPPVQHDRLMLDRIHARRDRPIPSSSDTQLSSVRPLDLDQSLGVTDDVSPLLEYAAIYMLDHAGEVEYLGLASYNMLQPGMSDSFMCYHRYFNYRTCVCFGGGLPGPLHPLHLAIVHGLDGYVNDFLSKLRERGSREWDDVFYLAARSSLLEFSIRHAIEGDEPGVTRASRTRIVAVVLDHHPCVHDAEMILALEESSPDVVELLLPHWPHGKMILKYPSWYDPLVRLGASRDRLLEFCQERFDAGPMWSIARRSRYLKLSEAAELIDIFVRRGEDINDQCKLGTALHGALFKTEYTREPEMLKLLVSKGADINASGRFGTPLALAWRMLNTDPAHFYGDRGSLAAAIEWLIESGAVNNRCDPSGSVPSREQMLSFCKSPWRMYW